VYTIFLEKIIVKCDAIHEKLDPLYLELFRNLPEDVFELCGITGAVVGGDSNTQQHDCRAGGFRALDDFLQIGLHARRRKASQTVVAAQFQYDQFRRKIRDRGFNASGTAFCRFATDTGVNDSIFVPLLIEARLQQSAPGLVNIYSITCAEAVAKYQDSWRFGTVRLDA